MLMAKYYEKFRPVRHSSIMSTTSIYFEERLEALDKNINSCVREISKLLQSFDTLSDSLDSTTFENKQAQEFGILLQEILSSVHSHQGLEEQILPHLGELRKQNGVSLLQSPCKPCQCQSEQQIDETKNSEDDVSSLWEQLCYHLEKHAFQDLTQRDKCYPRLQHDIIKYSLKSYISTLQNIYVPSRIWEMHQNFRLIILQQYRCPCISNELTCLSCLLKLCLNCMCEDLLLICTGHFQPVVITWTNVFNLYIKTLQEKVIKVLLCLDDWLKTKGEVPQTLSCLILFHSHCKSSSFHKVCVSCWIKEKNISDSISLFEELSKLHEKATNIQRNEICVLIYTDIILKIIEDIYIFEYQVATLFSNRLDVPTKLHLHQVDLSIVSEGIYSALPADSPDQSPLHQPTTDVQDETVCCSWDWRSAISHNGYLTHLQRMLQSRVQTIIHNSIEEEWQLFLSTGEQALSTLCIPCEADSVSIQCYAVFPSVLRSVKELEKFVPMVVASEGSLFPFKSSFSHTINSYVIDILKHIENIAREAPQKGTLYSLYAASSSALFLRDRLLKYSNLIGDKSFDEAESPLSAVCHSANQLVSGLVEDVLLCHMKYLSCGILHDADSHNWQHQKPFYEGERISYSIQMWNFYMRGLLSDIRCYMPQPLSQEIYTKVLCESLDQFVQRYSQCLPGEARTPQIRCDIIVLLLCTSEILYPACNSVSQIIGKGFEDHKQDSVEPFINKIHSSCCTLLAVLAVLTSPLPEIYKVFKKGFPLPSLSLRTKYTAVAPWLPWIRSTLFPESGKGPLMSNVAVWLSVRVCTSWFQPCPSAIIKAFTEHDCTLSILFMTQATTVPNEISDSSNNDYNSPNVKNHKLQLAKSVFQVLICYNHHSDYLATVLLPVIERTNGWKEFDSCTIEKQFNERPWWYQGMIDIMNPLMKSVLGGFIPVLLQKQRKYMTTPESEMWNKLKFKLTKFVNCTCDADLDCSIQDESSLVYVCITEILASILNYLMTLPLPLRKCLSSLDAHLSNYVHDAEPIHQSLPIQILFSLIICYLKDHKLMQSLIGISVSETAIPMCCSVADLLKNPTLQTDECGGSSPFYIELAKKQLSHIKQHFQQLSNNIEDYRSIKNNEELEKEALHLAATELIQQPGGEDMILYLQKLLCANVSWIQLSLGIPGVLSADPVVSPISPSPLPDPYNNHDVSDSSIGNCYSASSNRIYARRELKSATSAYGTLDDYHEPQETPILYEDGQQQHLDALLDKMQWNDLNDAESIVHNSLILDMNDFTLKNSSAFNPLKNFDQLGDSNFDQKAIAEYPLPWEALLSHLPLLGLTEVGFCNLLSHRWDVRKEGPLSTEQEGWVQELKIKYKLDVGF